MTAFLSWLIGIGGIGSATTLLFITAGVVFWKSTRIRQTAFWLAAISAIGTGLYTKGYDNGRTVEKAECAAREQRTSNKVDAARSDADRDVSRGVPDRFDRDDN